MRAQAALNRAIQARSLAAERHDVRVRDAEQRSAAEAAELARVCGSADAAAEILGWNVRDVRKVLKAEDERSAGGRARPRPQVASESGIGDTDADL
ncbi:hypothetical protein ACIPOG_00030 [Kriegella sp. LARHCF250]